MALNKTYDTLKGVLPDDGLLIKCIHCGMCLAVCPTYNETMMERSSPRGRIRMIRSVAEGKLNITGIFADEMDFCLDCQACETACPAGVHYGAMVEAARVETNKAGYGSFLGRRIKKIGLNFVLAKKSVLKLTARLLYIYQNWGIQKILRSIGFFRLFGKTMSEVEKLTPVISKTFSGKILKEYNPPEGEAQYKTAFLTGCLMDVCFADINIDTVEVLQKNGCEVVVPKGQECCGSLHAHYGEMDKAHQLAKVNLDAFSKYDYDYLVCNSAGCTAFMKEYAHIFKNDPVYAEKAVKFSAKVKDITEFLNMIDMNTDMQQLDEHITYHDACHLAHTQNITQEPRNVLAKIPGLKISELAESTWCCGSGGIYNVVRYNDSMKFLERKMNNIKNTGAGVVVTGNPGCMAQIKYGADKDKMKLEVIHPATLLNRAYKKNNDNSHES